MEKEDHRSLVRFIVNCEKTMRMVVLFEDCVLKVQLHTRFLRLRVSGADERELRETACLLSSS